jgi:hypothetical protein
MKLNGMLLVAVLPAASLAQTAGWHSSVEASASSLFGATSQTLASFATSLSHDGQNFTADANLKFRYGESEDADKITFVSARSWAFAATVDAVPKARWSPFLIGNVEASLEKAIDRRVAGGAGAKWTFARTPTASASVSLALLGENVKPLADTLPSKSLMRWSWRVKTEQRLADRLSFSHVTFYAPVIDAPGRFTIVSTSSGSFDLNAAVALMLSFVDNYDSEARGRGAPTNNDGSLMFGVRGKF